LPEKICVPSRTLAHVIHPVIYLKTTTQKQRPFDFDPARVSEVFHVRGGIPECL
jgi:hypothetical protein